nr:hypothetical protein [Tanacetum cinerariifolium]
QNEDEDDDFEEFGVLQNEDEDDDFEELYVADEIIDKLALKSGRYAILMKSNTAYWGCLAWAPRLLFYRIFINRLLIRRINALGYGVLGHLIMDVYEVRARIRHSS